MIYGSLYSYGHKNNDLFLSRRGGNSGEYFLPYGNLRQAFLAKGIELNTPDRNKGKSVSFEIHINVQRRTPKSRAYVYLFENPLIRPLNRDSIALKSYVKWFTWDGELLNDSRAVQLFYPNKIEVSGCTGPNERPLFLVLVARNKELATFSELSLAPLRNKIVNWYECHASSDFHLYGRGWDCPAALPGRLGKLYGQTQRIFRRFLPFPCPYKTWKGVVGDKIALLQKSRFCIAHENCRDLKGYITEKIFHCFRAGCVPVYIGPKEIHDFIPRECFIDGRMFNGPAEMDAFLRAIDDETYRNYQKSIRDFLLSERARLFSQEHFVETIVGTILADLAGNNL